jgi:hypothetical protein
VSHDNEAAARADAEAQWVRLNRAIWPDDGMPKERLAALLRRQVDEMLEAEAYHVNEELADLISLAARAIELNGYDLNRTMTNRLLSRHLAYAETLPEGWKAP